MGRAGQSGVCGDFRAGGAGGQNDGAGLSNGRAPQGTRPKTGSTRNSHLHPRLASENSPEPGPLHTWPTRAPASRPTRTRTANCQPDAHPPPPLRRPCRVSPGAPGVRAHRDVVNVSEIIMLLSQVKHGVFSGRFAGGARAVTQHQHGSLREGQVPPPCSPDEGRGSCP